MVLQLDRFSIRAWCSRWIGFQLGRALSSGMWIGASCTLGGASLRGGCGVIRGVIRGDQEGCTTCESSAALARKALDLSFRFRSTSSQMSSLQRTWMISSRLRVICKGGERSAGSVMSHSLESVMKYSSRISHDRRSSGSVIKCSSELIMRCSSASIISYTQTVRPPLRPLVCQ